MTGGQYTSVASQSFMPMLWRCVFLHVAYGLLRYQDTVFKLYPRIRCLKLPVYWGCGFIVRIVPFLQLLTECFDAWDSPVKELTGHDIDSDFRNVKPAPMFGGVMEFKEMNGMMHQLITSVEEAEKIWLLFYGKSDESQQVFERLKRFLPSRRNRFFWKLVRFDIFF